MAVDVVSQPTVSERVKLVPRTSIFPSPFNPRKRFSAEDLADLAESLRTEGMLQPIVVRQRPYVPADGTRAHQALEGLWPGQSLVATLKVVHDQVTRSRPGDLDEANWYTDLAPGLVGEIYRYVGETLGWRIDVVDVQAPQEHERVIRFRRWPDEAYEIICGERRWRAAEIA